MRINRELTHKYTQKSTCSSKLSRVSTNPSTRELTTPGVSQNMSEFNFENQVVNSFIPNNCSQCSLYSNCPFVTITDCIEYRISQYF